MTTAHIQDVQGHDLCRSFANNRTETLYNNIVTEEINGRLLYITDGLSIRDAGLRTLSQPCADLHGPRLAE